jgi:hypothetical protein
MLRASARRAIKALLGTIAGTAALALGSCQPYVEVNPDADVRVDFLAGASRLSFGTSTGGSTENSVVRNADGTVTLTAYNDTYNAGKIAGSEDGISYLFRRVEATKNFKLSADVKIVFFGGVAADGSTASNGQEGFGLMARDWVPQYPGLTIDDNLDAAPEYHAGSSGGSGNMVMVGGVKRGVRAALRQGVIETSGACLTDPLVTPDALRSTIEWWPKELGDYSMYATLEDRPDFPAKNSTYRLTLEKTNNEFIATILPPGAKGQEARYLMPYPKVLEAIDKDHYYVGLFASRSAKIVVSNIDYVESLCSQDPPYIAPELVKIAPSFEIISPSTDSDGSYQLICTSNVRGYVSLTQEGRAVPGADFLPCEWVTEPANGAVLPYGLFTIPVYGLAAGQNTFRAVFYPEEAADLNSSAPIAKVFQVERRSYFTADTPLYVAPEGRAANAGTLASPLDLGTAILFVQPGQTIYLVDGVYTVLDITIPRYDDGLFGKTKNLVALHRGKAVIDFDRNPAAKGFVLQGSYWVIDGIDVRDTPDKVKGFTVMGSNNDIRWVRTYGNGDTGLQISGRSTEPKRLWPRNNLVEYCDSHDNLDAAQNDADGFAAKLTVGEGNRFDWCASHNNCDDGWDLFTKKETGTIGKVVITNCAAYRNGTLSDGSRTYSGRNGFKLGGEGLSVDHQVTNCVSFQNGAHGFTSNSNPAVKLLRCTSFDNGVAAWNDKPGADSRNFTLYDGTNVIPATVDAITGILSLYGDPLILGVNRREDKVILSAPKQGYAWYGAGTGSSAGTTTRDFNGNVLGVADLASTTPPFDSEGLLRRRADGSFDLGDFLRLKTTTAFPVGASF